MTTVGNGPVATTARSKVHVLQVTIRHGDVFRRFGKFHMAKMSPYVEVSLGDRIIGTVPPATGADLKPVWNYTMPTEGFDSSHELELKVLDKHTWPRKDVVIGIGLVRLPEETLSGSERQLLEQTIKLFKKHRGDERPEFTGNISISLNILRPVAPPNQPTTRCIAPACEEPGFQTSVSNTTADASALSSALSRSSAGRNAPLPLDHGGVAETSNQGAADNGTAVTHLSLLATTEASLPPSNQLPMDEHLQLVTRHYFGRNVREERRRPVFCTSGVCELLRRRSCLKKCCGCCACAGGSALAAAWALGVI